METRANYTIIGAFTLAVIAAAFGFVYWFAGPQDSSGRKLYDIVFDGSVSGLREGNTVLFNGIPVGQVSKLNLVPHEPGKVLVQVSINSDVPVLSDAVAGLESQGLTGIMAVGIRGGRPDAPPLPPGPPPSLIPRITAEPGGGGLAGLASAGQDVAHRLNMVLAAINPDEVRAIITNVDTFTRAIADKSDDVKVLMEQSAALIKQLNEVAGRVETVVTNLQKATEDKDGLLAQATDAASSVRRLADNLDQRTALLTSEISRFTGPGLRQFEALASDGRRTLSEIDRTLRNISRNPQQFILGGNSTVPTYRR